MYINSTVVIYHLNICTSQTVVMTLQVDGGTCSKVVKISCSIDIKKISGFRDASDSLAM